MNTKHEYQQYNYFLQPHTFYTKLLIYSLYKQFAHIYASFKQLYAANFVFTSLLVSRFIYFERPN
ncbi:hypothetical protein PSPO_a1111 [Pseudoalteromonas spongiae UST010723-006]|nr:hypothetical protein PSPO_a1111 [Pseudoalteromonas spongiae UST010723-006]